MSQDLGARWADVVSRKDWDGLRALVADGVDFRGMTPGRTWEGSTPDEVVEVLGQWFEPTDAVESVELVETDAFADRQTAHYRLLVRNAEEAACWRLPIQSDRGTPTTDGTDPSREAAGDGAP